MQTCFSRVWVKFDPGLSFVIRRQALLALLALMPKPHGLGMWSTATGLQEGDGKRRLSVTSAARLLSLQSLQAQSVDGRPPRDLDEDDWTWPEGARGRAQARLDALHALALPAGETYYFEDVTLALGRFRHQEFRREQEEHRRKKGTRDSVTGAIVQKREGAKKAALSIVHEKAVL